LFLFVTLAFAKTATLSAVEAQELRSGEKIVKWGAVLIAVGVLTAADSKVWAEDYVDYDFGPCKRAAFDLPACEQREFAKQDVALNQVYSKLYRLYDPDQKRTLQTAERTWVRFRNEDCESAGSQYFYLMPLGEVELNTSDDKAGCLERTTRARVIELEHRYEEAKAYARPGR
jgi:uncharacterized protein YecT (DUF1311 family)